MLALRRYLPGWLNVGWPRMTDRYPSAVVRDLAVPILVLVAVWAAVAFVVNPCGQFSINDDWSFVKILEAPWSEGKMPATGWGKGGPSAIVHVLWGGLFRRIGGPSLTVLRLSVLLMGILASIALLILLRLAGAPRYLALWGALALVFNPLFLSQSFTFMTDVTFCTILIVSVLLLYLAVERSSVALAVVGLFFSLLAILTRQIGIVVPLAFVTACFVHPKGRDLGPVRVLFLTLAVAFAPWLGYEYFLSISGSTPVTKHDVFQNILNVPRSLGPWGYTCLLVQNLFLVVLGYSSFLVSPALALRYPKELSRSPLKQLFIALTLGFAAFEIAILAGWINPPVVFHRNVIFDFGIGPILLKDTYILKVRRVAGLPPALFYGVVYLAAVAEVTLWALAIRWLRRFHKRRGVGNGDSTSFLALLAFCAAAFYVGIILLTGFHDRYLIPVCALIIIWLAAVDGIGHRSLHWSGAVPAAMTMLIIGFFSVAAVHDFMELKRAQHRAAEYVMNQLGASPCDFDGGFEFNGYHCYKKGFTSAKGASWWWVAHEKYVLTLGPLPDYRVVKTIPFKRYLGSNGAIHVLAPVREASLADRRERGTGSDDRPCAPASAMSTVNASHPASP
jgi:4-amino-4-deoxy-L-arabinose transferase-like glycosyltransferase